MSASPAIRWSGWRKPGMVALIFANAPAAMAPWGGTRAVFGTDPIAFACPLPDRAPIVVDLSLSKVARGNILTAIQKGESIPEGWALDMHGKPTTDAKAALAGTMVPLGDAKGTALALMVELLAAGLTGANFAGEASSFLDAEGPPPGTGQLIIAIDASAFGNALPRFAALAESIEEQQGARLPGARRQASRKKRKAKDCRFPIRCWRRSKRFRKKPPPPAHRRRFATSPASQGRKNVRVRRGGKSGSGVFVGAGEPGAEDADMGGIERHHIGAIARRDAAEAVSKPQKFRRRARGEAQGVGERHAEQRHAIAHSRRHVDARAGQRAVLRRAASARGYDLAAVKREAFLHAADAGHGVRHQHRRAGAFQRQPQHGGRDMDAVDDQPVPAAGRFQRRRDGPRLARRQRAAWR